MKAYIHDRFDDLTVIDDISKIRIFTFGAGEVTIKERGSYGVTISTDKYLSPFRSVYNPSTCNAGVIFDDVNLNAGITVITHKRIPGITYCGGGEIVRKIENGKLTKVQFSITRAMADEVALWGMVDGVGLGRLYGTPYNFDIERWYVVKSYFWRDTSLGGYRVVSILNSRIMYNLLVKFTKIKDIGEIGEFVSEIPQPGWLDNITIINTISEEYKEYLNNLGYGVIA